MIENVILLNNTGSITRNPYKHYYATGTLTQFEQIEGFFIGDQQTSLTFDPSPERICDRMTETNGPCNIYVVVQRKKRAISQEEYVGIMRRFGSARGFEKLDMDILYPRV